MKRLGSFLLVATAMVLSTSMVFREKSFAADATSGSVRPAGSMLQPRSGHSATLLPNGRVLIAGGMRRNQDFYRSAELFDPATGKFSAAGEMSIGRVGHVAVPLRSGKVLIAGGWDDHGSSDSVELYEPATGRFTEIAKMTTKRGGPSAVLLASGDVLITGGAAPVGPGGIAAAEVFDSGKMIFEAVGSMHHARVSHTSTLLADGRVLIAGGRGENVTAVAELYDPKTKQFTATGNMLEARYKHTAGLLPDGTVLLAGGSTADDWKGTLKSAEIYDPRTGSFAAASLMNDARFKLPAEAAHLASGQLLIAGGSKQTEIYNPGTGKFSVASGQMSDAWHFMSETRLQDGRVLLAGGYANSDQATAQAWIYQP
jgi:Kelch motif protein/galactose oxidase-like protein